MTQLIHRKSLTILLIFRESWRVFYEQKIG